MSIARTLRTFYIKTTNLTQSYQGKSGRLVSFYRLWALCYDFSVGLDPAFRGRMKQMISAVVRPADRVLDIGCGTGISTFFAAEIGAEVTGIDISAQMLAKLEKKIARRKSRNIALVHGSFPEALPDGAMFNCIISSFAIVHFTPEQRKDIYRQIYARLEDSGRLGLFAAQGEIAPSFETTKELRTNLAAAGFRNVEIEDVSDIYRIVTALKPSG